MYRILLVEDDPVIAGAMKQHIGSWGLEAHCVEDFHEVLAAFRAVDPHLVLMDLALPFFNGYHWCGEIRKISSVPIVFVSSAADNMNMVMAMNMGADDFIAKPFDMNVLMAKIQALLRRSYDYVAQSPSYEHQGTVVSRDTLMMRLWETDSFIDENTLTVNIARLRRKLDAAGLPEFIVTKKGMGYMIG